MSCGMFHFKVDLGINENSQINDYLFFFNMLIKDAKNLVLFIITIVSFSIFAF